MLKPSGRSRFFAGQSIQFGTDIRHATGNDHAPARSAALTIHDTQDP